MEETDATQLGMKYIMLKSHIFPHLAQNSLQNPNPNLEMLFSQLEVMVLLIQIPVVAGFHPTLIDE